MTQRFLFLPARLLLHGQLPPRFLVLALGFQLLRTQRFFLLLSLHGLLAFLGFGLAARFLFQGQALRSFFLSRLLRMLVLFFLLSLRLRQCIGLPLRVFFRQLCFFPLPCLQRCFCFLLLCRLLECAFFGLPAGLLFYGQAPRHVFRLLLRCQ